jgi:hypothetical protein
MNNMMVRMRTSARPSNHFNLQVKVRMFNLKVYRIYRRLKAIQKRTTIRPTTHQRFSTAMPMIAANLSLARIVGETLGDTKDKNTARVLQNTYVTIKLAQKNSGGQMLDLNIIENIILS